MIATASSPEKRELTLELGANAAVDPETEDFNGALLEANGGGPVDTVFEMAGGRVFDGARRRSPHLDGSWPTASRAASRTSTSGHLMEEPRRDRLLAVPLPGQGELIREPLADLYERAARGERAAVATT